MSASKLGVEVGSHNLYEDDPDQVKFWGNGNHLKPGQTHFNRQWLQASFAVSDVGLHEDYDSWNINNDICMLTLEGSIRSENQSV